MCSCVFGISGLPAPRRLQSGQGRKDKSRLALIDVKRASLALAVSHTLGALSPGNWTCSSPLTYPLSQALSLSVGRSTLEDANGSIELQRFIMMALILLRGLVSLRLRMEPEREKKGIVGRPASVVGGAFKFVQKLREKEMVNDRQVSATSCRFALFHKRPSLVSRVCAWQASSAERACYRGGCCDAVDCLW